MLFIDSPKLVSLHQQFLECVQENPMRVVTFVESYPTEFTALKVPILCVPKSAAGKLKLFTTCNCSEIYISKYFPVSMKLTN